jgi:putative NADPH-quinone reductase
MDVVLVSGFAYGPGGSMLRGKDFLQAVSTGAPAEAYRAGGRHRHPLAEFLRPYEQMAHLCGMRHLPPLVIQGGESLPDAAIAAHARRYRELLEAYRPGA